MSALAKAITATRTDSTRCGPYGDPALPVSPGWRITATCELRQLKGDQRPYFSATGEIVSGRTVQGGGCIHKEILHYFPELAPVVKVHLADNRGWPMYAVENAIYWSGLSVWRDGKPMPPTADYYGGTLETDGTGLVWAPETLARHLRTDVDSARAMRAYVVGTPGSDREGWRFVFHGLEDRWQAEADAALAVIRAPALNS